MVFSDIYEFMASLEMIVVVVLCCFYVHGKHLRSHWDGQLTKPHFSWAGLDIQCLNLPRKSVVWLLTL